MNTSSNQEMVVQPAEPKAFIYEDVSSGEVGGARGGSSSPATAGGGAGKSSEEEIDRLVREARSEGMREAERLLLAKMEETVSQERARFAGALEAFHRERADYYSKVESELVRLALAIAAKILHREAQVDHMLVAGLVKVMLEQMNQNTKVILRVRPESVSAWRHHFSDNANVQIEGDASVQPRDCLVVTELGTADMGIEAQLKEIEQGLFDLLAQRPDSR